MAFGLARLLSYQAQSPLEAYWPYTPKALVSSEQEATLFQETRVAIEQKGPQSVEPSLHLLAWQAYQANQWWGLESVYEQWARQVASS